MRIPTRQFSFHSLKYWGRPTRDICGEFNMKLPDWLITSLAGSSESSDMMFYSSLITQPEEKLAYIIALSFLTKLYSELAWRSLCVQNIEDTLTRVNTLLPHISYTSPSYTSPLYTFSLLWQCFPVTIDKNTVYLTSTSLYFTKVFYVHKSFL